MILENSLVLSNIKVSESTYLLSVTADKSIKHCAPGQFYMLKCKNDIFTLRRPISLHYADKNANILEFYYETKGKGTQDIASLVKGDTINIQGPLGNGFDTSISGKDILVIGGGMGIAPMKYLTETLSPNNKITFIVGSRNSGGISILKNFELENIQTYVTTDDGSVGMKGNVVDKLETLLQEKTYSAIYVCGPEPMMVAAAKVAMAHDVLCYISLEARMACGVKACVGCSIKTNDGMKKVCHDGPVFSSTTIVDFTPITDNSTQSCNGVGDK